MLNKKNNLIGMGLLVSAVATSFATGVYADNTAIEEDATFEDASGLVPDTSVLKGGTYNIGDKVPESIHEENIRLITKTNKVYKYLGESDFSINDQLCEVNSNKEITKLCYVGSKDIEITMKRNGSPFGGYSVNKRASEITFHQPLKRSDKLEITIKKSGYVSMVADFYVKNKEKWVLTIHGTGINLRGPAVGEDGSFVTPGIKKRIYTLKFPDGTIGSVEVPFYVTNQVAVTVEYREENGKVLKTEENVFVPYQEYLKNVLSYPGRSIKSVDRPMASKKGQKIIVTLKSGTDYEPQVVVPTLKVGEQANEASYVKNLPEGASVRVIKKIDTSSVGVKEFELGITLAGQKEKAYKYTATVVDKESTAGTEALQKEIEELKKQVSDKNAEINKLSDELKKIKAEGDKTKIAELKSKIDGLNEELNKEKQRAIDLQTKVTELTGNNSDLEKEKNKLQAKLDSAKDELDAANKNVQKLTGELDNTKLGLEAKNAEIARLKAQIEKLKKDLENASKDDSTQLKELKDLVRKLEDSLEETKMQLQKAETTIEAKKEEAQANFERIANLTIELEKEKKKTNPDKEKMTELEDEIAKAKEEKTRIAAEKKNLEDSVSELKKSNEAKEKKVKELQDKIMEGSNSSARILELEQEIIRKDSEIRDLEKKYNDEKANAGFIFEELQKERAKSTPNEARIKDLEEKLASSNEVLKESMAKIAKMSKSLEKTKEALGKVKKENDSKYPEDDGYGKYSKADIERQKDRLDDALKEIEDVIRDTRGRLSRSELRELEDVLRKAEKTYKDRDASYSDIEKAIDSIRYALRGRRSGRYNVVRTENRSELKGGNKINSLDIINMLNKGSAQESAPEKKSTFTIGSNTFQYYVNGELQTVKMDVAPYIKNGRTMLPLRYVSMAIGKSVGWTPATQTAEFGDYIKNAKVTIGSNKIVMNDGTVIEMDAAPEIVNNRMFVSITNIAKVFGMTNGDISDGTDNDIEWNGANKTVTVIRQ